MPRRKADTQQEQEEQQRPGIEVEFARLEEIIKKLEAGDNTLEEAFAGYEMGMKLVKSLSSQIDQVEKKIQILSEGDEHE